MNTSYKNEDLFAEDNIIDLKEILRKYLDYKLWFVGSVLISLAIAFFYLRHTPITYSSSAKIKLLTDAEAATIPSIANLSSLAANDINHENEIEILSSYRLKEALVRKLNLTHSFSRIERFKSVDIEKPPFNFEQTINQDSIKSFKSYEVYLSTEELRINSIINEKEQSYLFKDFNTRNQKHSLPFEIDIPKSMVPELIERKFTNQHFLINFVPIHDASLSLQQRIQVKRAGEFSDVMQLSISSQLKDKNEQILNSLIDVYNSDGVKDKQLVDRNTIEFIDKRFESLEGELNTIEENIKVFKQENSFVDLRVSAPFNLEKQNRADAALFDIETQQVLTQMLLESLQTQNSELLPENIGVNNTSVNSIVYSYNEMVLERTKLLNSGGANNPNVLLLNKSISEFRANLDRSLNDYSKQIEESKKQWKLRNQLHDNSVASLPLKEKRLREIERKQKIKESLYILLLEKREIAAIQLAVTEPIVKVVDYALSSAGIVATKSKIVYTAGIALGLLLPFSVLFVLFAMDTKIHNRKDIEKEVSDANIIGEIPEVPRSQALLYTNPNERTILAEATRILSANLEFFLSKKGKEKGKAHVVLCTSSIQGEGKSFAAMNLSLAMSSLNKKVLLIGGDLRNPQIHKYLKIDKKRGGLVNYLMDNSYDWKSSIIKSFENHPTHEILIAGILPPRPTQLLTNGNFEKLIEEAKSSYDYIVIDSAPTLLVTDTLLMADLADVTIYLTRANHTDKKLIAFYKDLKQKGKLKNLAIVINGLGPKNAYGYGYGYKYGYKYGYNYGYSYGYSEKVDKKKTWRNIFRA